MYGWFLHSKKGFTYVEVMVVVAVMAVLVGIAVPIYSFNEKKQRQKDCENQRQVIETTVKQAMFGMIDNGKRQEKIPGLVAADKDHIEETHVYKAPDGKRYLKLSLATLGDIRGGYRIENSFGKFIAPASSVPGTPAKTNRQIAENIMKTSKYLHTEYRDGCKHDYYLKKYALIKTPIVEYLANSEMPVCEAPTKDEYAEYLIDENGNVFCTYCNGDKFAPTTESSTSNK